MEINILTFGKKYKKIKRLFESEKTTIDVYENKKNKKRVIVKKQDQNKIKETIIPGN